MSEPSFITAIWPYEMVQRLISQLKRDGRCIETFGRDVACFEKDEVVFLAHEHGTRYAIELNLKFFEMGYQAVVEIH